MHLFCCLFCDLLRDIFCACIVGGSHWTESTRRVSLISISVNVCHFSSFSLISIRHPRFFSLFFFFSVHLLFLPRCNVHFTLSVVAVTIFLLLIVLLLFFLFLVLHLKSSAPHHFLIFFSFPLLFFCCFISVLSFFLQPLLFFSSICSSYSRGFLSPPSYFFPFLCLAHFLLFSSIFFFVSIFSSTLSSVSFNESPLTLSLFFFIHLLLFSPFAPNVPPLHLLIVPLFLRVFFYFPVV
ncbi:unnamed protein product [Acanthosepion pharaonis]|uniref:T. brucei spp.-specific protein n=1 Tax=Acanthosepion pharaonis TaxID=158019 RepID=A0A812DQ31_ACAPH|nr:unnamed protein product [Sepia pharaonis]